MKRLSLFFSSLVFVVSCMPLVAAALPLDQFGAPLPIPINQLFKPTCDVEASIKATAFDTNQVTYKVKYRNPTSKNIPVDFAVLGSTATPNNVIMHYNFHNSSTMVPGSHYLLLKGTSIEQTFSFSTKGVDVINLSATLGTTKCKGVSLKTLPTIPPLIIRPVIIKPITPPVIIVQPLRPNPVMSCSVSYEDGLLRADGSYGFRAALSYNNLKKGVYNYMLTGTLSQIGAAVQTHQGAYAAQSDGSGVIKNSEGQGFLFEYSSARPGDSVTITAKLGTTNCTPLTFIIPETSEVPAAGTTPPVVTPPTADGGTVNDTDSIVQNGTQPLAQQEQALALPGTDTPWQTYAFYTLLAVVLFGGLGYGIYRLGKSHHGHFTGATRI